MAISHRLQRTRAVRGDLFIQCVLKSSLILWACAQDERTDGGRMKRERWKDEHGMRGNCAEMLRVDPLDSRKSLLDLLWLL